VAIPSLRHLSVLGQDNLRGQIVSRGLGLVPGHLASWQMHRCVVIVIDMADMNLLVQFDDEDMLPFWNPIHLGYHSNSPIISVFTEDVPQSNVIQDVRQPILR
jgi:hypothetical protein